MRSSKIVAAATVFAALTLFTFSASGLAQKEPPPKTGCSPGFYKNHPEIWVGMGCGGATSDADLLTALTCKGADASCGRSAAAAILDACTGCTE